MKRIPVFKVEGKGWWKKDMEVLRKGARAREDAYFLPCPYCHKTTCSQSPVKPGVRDTDEGTRIIAARFAPPIHGPARVVLTSCEEAAFAALKVRLGYTKTEEKVRVEKQEPAPKPILPARQTAKRILAACSRRKGRTTQRLCDMAGIDATEGVQRVLAFLADNGTIVQVMGNRWVLA